MKKHFKRLICLTIIIAMSLSVLTACDGLVKKYTLAFDANGGENAPETILSIRSGSTVKEPSKKPTRGDFTFTKWYKESDCTTAWDFSVDTVTENTTLYAGWTVTRMTVTFDANGGTGVPKAVTGIKPGTKILEPYIYYRPGYDFTGWYTAATAKTAEKFEFRDNTITSDITLYAGWEFDLDDYKEYAAFQVSLYYWNIPFDKRGDIDTGGILASDIQYMDGIRSYLGSGTSKSEVDLLFDELKNDIADISGISYLSVIKNEAKTGVELYADEFKVELEIEDIDPIAISLDTIVQKASADIDAAATVDAVDALGISANAELGNAVLETYKAYYTAKFETAIAEALEGGEFSADEIAVINARKAELLDLLNVAETFDAAAIIRHVPSNILWMLENTADLFFYYDEKAVELREWVDAIKSANDFNPDALEAINSYYMDFLCFSGSAEGIINYNYRRAAERIFGTISAVDGEAPANWYVEYYYLESLNYYYQRMTVFAGSDETVIAQIEMIYNQAILDIKAASGSGQMEGIIEAATGEMGNIVLDNMKIAAKAYLDTEITDKLIDLNITPEAQLAGIIETFKTGCYEQIDAAENMNEINEILIGIIYGGGLDEFFEEFVISGI